MSGEQVPDAPVLPGNPSEVIDAPAAPEAPAEPTFQPAQGSWKESIDPALREATSLQNVDSLDDLVRQFDGQQTLIGKKGVILPTEGDVDDTNRFFNEIGRPKTASEYDLGDFAPPDQVQWSQDVQDGVVSKMHEAGLTNPQVNSILREYAGLQAKQAEVYHKQVTDNRDAIKTQLVEEWGGAEKFEAQKDLAFRAVRAILQTSDIDAQVFENTLDHNGNPIGDNPVLIKMFNTIGKAMSEDELIGGKLEPVRGNTPNQAGDEIMKLQTDTGFMEAYWNGDHPQHKMAVDRMRALHKEKDGVDLVPDAPQFR